MTLHEIPGYRLRLPNRQDVFVALSNALDERSAIQLWSEACKALDFSPTLAVFEMDQLQKLADWLMTHDNLARIVGCSLNVRMLAYRQLAARLQAQESQNAK